MRETDGLANPDPKPKRKLFVEIPLSHGGSTLRRPTPIERREALAAEAKRKKLLRERAKLQTQLNKLQDKISAFKTLHQLSKVFYDSDGFPYYVRTFIATGRTSLI